MDETKSTGEQVAVEQCSVMVDANGGLVVACPVDALHRILEKAHAAGKASASETKPASDAE